MSNPLDDPADRAAATVIAQRFVNRELPVDDLTVIGRQFLRSEERVLESRQALETWMTGRGLATGGAETMAELILQLDNQLPA